MRAWPNPSRAGESIRIAFAAFSTAPTHLAIYDLAGRRVDSQDVAGSAFAVPSMLNWTPRVREPGLYFLRLEGSQGVLASTRLVVTP